MSYVRFLLDDRNSVCPTLPIALSQGGLWGSDTTPPRVLLNDGLCAVLFMTYPLVIACMSMQITKMIKNSCIFYVFPKVAHIPLSKTSLNLLKNTCSIM